MAPHQGQFILDHTVRILPAFISSIVILLFLPSGPTGAVPLGDAHLSPLMRAPPLWRGEARRGGGNGEEAVEGSTALTALSPVMDDRWEIKKARSRVISVGISHRRAPFKDERVFDRARR
ncbi:unnamed protein product [Pleuronectes platessa]|uniref:Uncharacterized protein n=1 Tax=Pleuronectes platessa TaxID=8262 RepID=A0A9N7Y782_PLEPL|nr:unnamed protein product [Pleuronectes platessa]